MAIDKDEPGGLRRGEEIDAVALGEFLRANFPESDEPLEIRQFPHGHSNLTYLVRFGGREMVLRRPPFGNQVKSAHDMAREYRVLSKLHAAYPPAPRVFLYCDDLSVMGAPFYLMERRHGIILRKSLPTDGSMTPQLMRRICESAIDQLARLHAVDFEAISLGDLGRPAGYVGRQVAGWIDRYQKAKTSEIEEMGRVAEWLQANQPGESAAALIHNDYKFDNLVLDAEDSSRIVAVLDWEMATLGDPWMDVGGTLSYWIQADDSPTLQSVAMNPTMAEGCFTRKEIVARYSLVSGRCSENIQFYYAFGLYKTAVIVQQIHARHLRGHTTDPRFAHLDRVVLEMCKQADRVISGGDW